MSRNHEPDAGGWEQPDGDWWHEPEGGSRLAGGGRAGRSVRPAGRGRTGRRRYSRRTKIIGSVAILLVTVLVAGSLVVYFKYRAVWDSIKRVNVNADLTHRPRGFGNALNVLLIGSDSRYGAANHALGGGAAAGQRSDTIMIVHISPSPHRVVVLSIPRDSVVPILRCAPEAGAPGQQAQAGQVEQINATFAFGGPGCLWKTVEQTTHIRLDDFIELNFAGFVHVINDLGGVNVCLPFAVDDQMSGLRLSRGRHHVWGRQALAFWRTRENLGTGSDLQRIQRDQFLMISVLHGIEKRDLLGSPLTAARVIGDVAKSMTTNSGLTLGRMLLIAEGLRGLSAASAQFIEVPTVPYPGNPQAWVEWPPQDAGLFAAIAHNVRVPKIRKPRTARTARTAGAIRPSQVRVEVLNGSGAAGVAGIASAQLARRGFDVIGSGNAGSFSYAGSVVQYAGPPEAAAARAVRAQLAGAALQPNASLPPGTVDLILGSNFTSLKSGNPGGRAHAGVSHLAKTYGGLTGNTNVCKDQTAFAS